MNFKQFNYAPLKLQFTDSSLTSTSGSTALSPVCQCFKVPMTTCGLVIHVRTTCLQEAFIDMWAKSRLQSFKVYNPVQWSHKPALHRSSNIFFKSPDYDVEDYMSHDMTKQTKWLCAQWRLRSAWASAQSDQSFRCAVRMKKPWVLSYSLSAQRRLWSDRADAQADLSLRWAHSHIVGFDMSRLIFHFHKKK